MLQYTIGFRMQKIYGMVPVGPKKETNQNKYEETIQYLYQNIQELGNLKKLKVKEIENKIFGKEITEINSNIWLGRISKHHSINYKIALDLMPIIPGQICVFCGVDPDNMEHMLVTCRKLRNVRKLVEHWLGILRDKPTKISKEMMIDASDVEDDVEQFIWTTAKTEIWNHRNKVKFENAQINTLEIKNKIDQKVRFQIQHAPS